MQTAPEGSRGLSPALDATAHLPGAEQAQLPTWALTHRRPAEMQLPARKVWAAAPHPQPPWRSGVTVKPGASAAHPPWSQGTAAGLTRAARLFIRLGISDIPNELL